jgi:uncharacterized protein YndB with AHSA1/START domain
MAGATFEVTREATIAAPPERVYELLSDFHRWVEWSPWEALDPDLQRTYSGAPSGVGAVYEWSGNRKAGQGRMEITGATPPKHLEIALQFLKPFKSSNTTTFELEDSDGITVVTWRMIGPKTLATRVMGIFTSMDKLVGRDFERGLANLSTATRQT